MNTIEEKAYSVSLRHLIDKTAIEGTVFLAMTEEQYEALQQAIHFYIDYFPPYRLDGEVGKEILQRILKEDFEE